MQKLEQLFLRLYLLVFLFLNKIQLWAQDDGEGYGEPSRRGGDADFMNEGMMDYQPFRISMSDVLLVVALLIACYVFGKIWKGCSYLLLVFAAMMYFMMR